MKRFVALMSIVVLVAGCGRTTRQSVDIPDVTKPITLTLAPPSGGTRPINYLTLQIHGRINGHAELSFSESVTNSVGPRFTVKRTGNYAAAIVLFVTFHDASPLEGHHPIRLRLEAVCGHSITAELPKSAQFSVPRLFGPVP